MEQTIKNDMNLSSFQKSQTWKTLYMAMNALVRNCFVFVCFFKSAKAIINTTKFKLFKNTANTSNLSEGLVYSDWLSHVMITVYGLLYFKKRKESESTDFKVMF